MDQNFEIRPIPGFEGCYEISNTGKVYSCKRFIRGNGNSVRLMERSERTLTPDRKGYLTVPLSKNGISKTYKVHRLVAMTFIPNPENKPQVNHKDGNKQNNNAQNLEWATNTENVIHSYKLGLQTGLKGSKNPGAKLHDEDVDAIRKLIRTGDFETEDLAKEYGVTTTSIRRILSGKLWKNIPDPYVQNSSWNM